MGGIVEAAVAIGVAVGEAGAAVGAGVAAGAAVAGEAAVAAGSLLWEGLSVGLAAIGSEITAGANFVADLFGPIAGMTSAEAGAAGEAGMFAGASETGTQAGSIVATVTEGADAGASLTNFGGNVAENLGANSFAQGTAYTGEVTAGMGGSPGVISSAVPDIASGIPGAIPGVPGAADMVGTGAAALNNAGVPANMVAEMTAGLNAAPSAGTWWAGLDPRVQAAIIGGGIFAGGQMATGALGGLFAGVTAEKKLELEQLINQQRQNQVQYLNANNQYAPSLAFKKVPGPAGMLSTTDNSLTTVNKV